MRVTTQDVARGLARLHLLRLLHLFCSTSTSFLRSITLTLLLDYHLPGTPIQAASSSPSRSTLFSLLLDYHLPGTPIQAASSSPSRSTLFSLLLDHQLPGTPIPTAAASPQSRSHRIRWL